MYTNKDVEEHILEAERSGRLTTVYCVQGKGTYIERYSANDSQLRSGLHLDTWMDQEQSVESLSVKGLPQLDRTESHESTPHTCTIVGHQYRMYIYI